MQNVTHAQTAYVGAPPPSDECEPGRAAPCFHDCFVKHDGVACDLLSVMFVLGDGVARDLATAHRLQARACELGVCGGIGEPLTSDAAMTTPGAVVIYGGFQGTIRIEDGAGDLRRGELEVGPEVAARGAGGVPR